MKHILFHNQIRHKASNIHISSTQLFNSHKGTNHKREKEDEEGMRRTKKTRKGQN